MNTCEHLIMAVTTTFGNVMLGTCVDCGEPLDRTFGEGKMDITLVGGTVRGGNPLCTYP